MAPTPLDTTVTRPALSVMAGLVLFALVGCTAGATDADTSPAEPESGTTTENDDAAGGGDTGAGTDFGTITVEGTTYTVLESVNCELVEITDQITEVFNAIAVAQSADGEDALFFAYTQEQAGESSSFIDYQGPEGTWASDPGAATFTLTGGVLAGSSALVDDGGTESILVDFSFEVPDQLVEC